MRKQIEYAWIEKRVFIQKRLPIPIVRKKSGKVIEKVTVPIDVKMLLLKGDFITTQFMRCVPVYRSGVLTWAVSQLIEPVKPLWPMLKLHPEPREEPSWKRWASMTAAEFSNWLSKVLGAERAAQALGEQSDTSFF